MPFEFFGHRDRAALGPASASSDARALAPGPSSDAAGTAAFEAFTEEGRIVGRVPVADRLSDALNRRVPIPVYGALRGCLERPDLEPAPDLSEIDPYELVVVAAGPDSEADLLPERRAALRVRKTRYEVCCEVPGGMVCGTVHLHPGTVPADLLGHRPELLVAVTGADVRIGGLPPSDARLDVAFVNRTYLQGIVPLDQASVPLTRDPVPPTPGDAGTVEPS